MEGVGRPLGIEGTERITKGSNGAYACVIGDQLLLVMVVECIAVE